MNSTLDIALQVIVRPLFAILFFALLVIPLELLLAKVIPDSRVKAVLFDRTLRDRRPWVFTAAWFVIVGSTIAVIYLLFRPD